MKKITINKIINSKEYKLVWIISVFLILVFSSNQINEKVLEKTNKNSELKFKLLDRDYFQIVNIIFPQNTIKEINKRYLKDYPLETAMCFDLKNFSIGNSKIMDQTESDIISRCGWGTELHTHTYTTNQKFFCRPSPLDIEFYELDVTACVACGDSSGIKNIVCWKKI